MPDIDRPATRPASSRRRFATALAVATLGLGGAFAAGCGDDDSEGNADEAGQAIDNATEDAQDAADNATEDAQDAAEDAQDAADDAAGDAQDAIDDAQNQAEDALNGDDG